ncbi:MAG: hypothetical protein ACRD2H_08640 [Terriglobales bacterium]
MSFRSAAPRIERSSPASALLAGMLLLALPAAGQRVMRVSAPAPNSRPASRQNRDQGLATRARLRWEHHEAKVKRRLERQRIQALKRKKQENRKERPPAAAR